MKRDDLISFLKSVEREHDDLSAERVSFVGAVANREGDSLRVELVMAGDPRQILRAVLDTLKKCADNIDPEDLRLIFDDFNRAMDEEEQKEVRH